MDPQEIKKLLEAALPDCSIDVSGDGRHFDLLIIGDVFAEVRTIKRQQMVYRTLNEHIASGAIHAVNMKLFTASEWAAK